MELLKGVIAALVFCSTLTASAQANWQTKLQQELPLLGDRNWIAVVDSAYPLQVVSPGVETIEIDTDEVTVVRGVLNDLAHAHHVRPVVYMDAELPYVSEKDAPGVTAYRRDIHEALGSIPVHSVLHAKSIAQLDERGKTFRVLILKTKLTVPYSSVFLLLKCGYWSDAPTTRILRKFPSRGA